MSALSHDGIFAALLKWLAAAQLVDTCDTPAEDSLDTAAFAESLLSLSPAKFAEYFCARISSEAAKALEAAEVAPCADNHADCSRSGTADAGRGDAGRQHNGQQPQHSTCLPRLSGRQEGFSATQHSPGLVDNVNFPSLGSSTKTTKVTPARLLHSY